MFFKKSENYYGDLSDYRGNQGPLEVIPYPNPSQIGRAVIDSAYEMGFTKKNLDYNAEIHHDSPFYYQSTRSKDLTRCDTFSAFISPLLENPLLTIKNNFDFDFLNALQANKKFINENKIKYEPLNVDLLKKYSFDNENTESYSASEHLNKVINAEYFNDLHNYGYGEKIIKATSFAELNYIKTFHLYPANVFALNEVLDLVERESLKGGMIIDYPSGIGNIFLYLSKFFENDLFCLLYTSPSPRD